MTKNSLTLDVGGMGIKVIYFNANKEIIKTDYLCYEKTDTSERVDLTYILNVIIDYINTYDSIIDVGICFPGIIDIDNQEILSESYVINVDNIKIGEIILSSCKNIDLFIIENDAKSAAIGELNFGAAQGYKDCVLMTVGSGIGGGLILNSELRNGPHFLAGELSKIYSEIDSFSEVYIGDIGSTMALQLEYARLNNQHINDINGKIIMDEYRQNNVNAIKSVHKITNILAKAMFDIFVIVDVEAFLIGGGISSDETFIKQLKKDFNKYLEQQRLERFSPEIIQCNLGNNAGCYGMLYKLLELS